MGGHFGELAKVRGIVTYKISPFEQRAFAKAFSHGVPNMFRRFRSNVFRVVPAFIVGYVVFDLTEKHHTFLGRKNPADFADEQ